VRDRFVARNSRFRLLLIILGAIGFVVAGAWIAGLFDPPSRVGREWVGWISMFFFGLCAVAAVPRLFDESDQIVIDGNGIFWRRRSTTTIPWTAVQRWQIGQVRSQRFICLFLKDPTQFPHTGVGALLGGVNRGMGFGDVALSAVGTDRTFDEMLAAVESWGPSQG
jgi:hypothetical protein